MAFMKRPYDMYWRVRHVTSAFLEQATMPIRRPLGTRDFQAVHADWLECNQKHDVLKVLHLTTHLEARPRHLQRKHHFQPQPLLEAD